MCISNRRHNLRLRFIANQSNNFLSPKTYYVTVIVNCLYHIFFHVEPLLGRGNGLNIFEFTLSSQEAYKLVLKKQNYIYT